MVLLLLTNDVIQNRFIDFNKIGCLCPFINFRLFFPIFRRTVGIVDCIKLGNFDWALLVLNCFVPSIRFNQSRLSLFLIFFMLRLLNIFMNPPKQKFLYRYLTILSFYRLISKLLFNLFLYSRCLCFFYLLLYEGIFEDGYLSRRR